MKRIITISIVVITILLLSACSKDNKILITGTWIADETSQVVGSDEEIGHYNVLEFTTSEIHLKLLSSVLTGSEVSSDSDIFDEKHYQYEWISRGLITINNIKYEVEINKQEMILKNKNIEIHYNKISQD